MMSWMSENIDFQILSVADIQSTDGLAAIGRVLDGYPDLAPNRMGHRDPPRTRVTSVEAQLVDWSPAIHPGDYFNQFMVRVKEPPRTHGLLWVTGDIWNFPPIGPHRFDFGVEEDWLDRPERRDAFAELFLRECEAFDGFWGLAGMTSTWRQRYALVARAENDRTLVIPGILGDGWDMREHAVWDISWLNYFGPAFVDHWGRERLAGLGVRQEPTTNGGVVIWATPTPFVYDSTVTSLSGYPWKQRFYEALGWDALLHDRWRDPGAGVAVPDYHAHRQFAGMGRRQPRT
jgi:hypothetical protein